MAKRNYIGTDDIVGATVTRVAYDELFLEIGGRTLVVSIEYADDYNSFCEGDCSCCCSGSATGYFRAEEEVG